MSGNLLRVGADHAGKPPRAADFNTIADREAQFPAGGADVWWLDDEFDSRSFISADAGGVQVLPPGTLPNRTWFAPFDWPDSGMLVRRPKVVRVLLCNSVNYAHYPGDPELVETGSGGGFPFQDHLIGDRLFNTIAPAVEASLAGTDVLFCLHQPWHVDADFGSARFLRALAPRQDDDFYASDVLNLVLLFQSFVVDSDGGDWVVVPWNFNPPSYESTYGNGSFGDPFTGLDAAYGVDAPAIVAAHPRFPRHRTVLFDCDPGDQTLVPGPDDDQIAEFDRTRSDNVAQLTAIAADLSGSGVEYGGSFDPLTDDGSGLVALVAAHFGL